MSDKEFTLEIEGNTIYCSREPKTPKELSRVYAAIIKVKSQLTDNIAREAMVNLITEGNK